jgi:hypothetical protein
MTRDCNYGHVTDFKLTRIIKGITLVLPIIGVNA